ncbi:30S ribosomal protein S7 [Candidatus Woesearchaeota archaeon]|nr:30S ribosomal protein S7 [Candidatus Woesearchaeota archaeon]
MVEVKAFNMWSVQGIKIEDEGLKDYINLEPRFVPKTGARYAKSRFHKSKTFIVERLMNKLMVPGHKGKKHFRTSYKATGKGNTAYQVVEDTLKIIEKKTKRNPVEVLAKAVENGAPREEIVTIEYGGARYAKATECGPQRRVDLALRHIVQGAYARSSKRKTSAAEALAAELIDAYNLEASSNAISKKRDLERQSDSSR